MGKVRLVCETSLVRYLADREVACQQEQACSLDPAAEHISMYGLSRRGFEPGPKM
jgi:hypothetical protein